LKKSLQIQLKAEEVCMSIKGAVKRLEGVLARRNSGQTMTFVIPYSRDRSQTERIKTQLTAEHAREGRHDVLPIFVIDFATNSMVN
jgi:hypothetical protein